MAFQLSKVLDIMPTMEKEFPENYTIEFWFGQLMGYGAWKPSSKLFFAIS